MTNEEILLRLSRITLYCDRTFICNINTVKDMIERLKSDIKKEFDTSDIERQVNKITKLRKVEHDKQQARKQARANGNG